MSFLIFSVPVNLLREENAWLGKVPRDLGEETNRWIIFNLFKCLFFCPWLNIRIRMSWIMNVSSIFQTKAKYFAVSENKNQFLSSLAEHPLFCQFTVSKMTWCYNKVTRPARAQTERSSPVSVISRPAAQLVWLGIYWGSNFWLFWEYYEIMPASQSYHVW